jgi:DNA polymerase III gamma/tau subunit
LEEPRPNLLFILATTESNKIPLTINSRCQKYNFSRVSNDSLNTILVKVCNHENITIDPSSARKIVEMADGSARDLLTIIDQVKNYSINNLITMKDIMAAFAIVEEDTISNYVDLLMKGNFIDSFEIIKQIYELGKDVNIFFSNVFNLLIEKLYIENNESILEMCTLITKFISESKNSSNLIKLSQYYTMMMSKVSQNKDVTPNHKKQASKNDSEINSKNKEDKKKNSQKNLESKFEFSTNPFTISEIKIKKLEPTPYLKEETIQINETKVNINSKDFNLTFKSISDEDLVNIVYQSTDEHTKRLNQIYSSEIDEYYTHFENEINILRNFKIASGGKNFVLLYTESDSKMTILQANIASSNINTLLNKVFSANLNIFYSTKQRVKSAIEVVVSMKKNKKDYRPIEIEEPVVSKTSMIDIAREVFGDLMEIE